jgi:hypothetical protein
MVILSANRLRIFTLLGVDAAPVSYGEHFLGAILVFGAKISSNI